MVFVKVPYYELKYVNGFSVKSNEYNEEICHKNMVLFSEVFQYYLSSQIYKKKIPHYLGLST